TLVTTIHCQDGDAGDDGTVEFILQHSGSPFYVDEATGGLYAGTGLDYEVTQSYTLTITIVDKSRTSIKSSTGTFNVIIINENESDPVCETVEPIIVTPNSHDVGDMICQLNCTDLDLNTALRFAILRDHSSMFHVQSSTGSVRLRAQPVAGSHIVVIGVSDQSKPERLTEVFVHISVETKLKFTNLPDRTSLSEDAGINSLVYNVSASGAYENIIYEIINGNNDRSFTLHQTKGEFRLVRRLDRETISSYNISIRATTRNGQTIDDTLLIDINDINDNCPIYSSSFDHISVSESVSFPTTLMQITATDRDILENAEIVYRILSGDPDNMFKYTSNGELQLVKHLDFETQPFHTLLLCAVNKVFPPLNSTMIVNVGVIDEDDNNFKIMSSGGKISLLVPEDAALGAPVVKIQVQNNDTISDLTFTIISGNSKNNFTIDERTGEVYLIFALDRETAAFLTLTIHVSGSSGKTDTTIVNITITDVNDNKPVFTPYNYVFLVPYGTSAGTAIGTLSVTDSDAGVNKDLTLSITSGNTNNAFRLSGTTLIAASLLNSNLNSHYELQIMASDHGMPAGHATANVSILIQSELKMPKFSPKTNEISIEETCLPGVVLYDANATFRGATEKSLNHPGDLVYSLRSGDTATFYVDPDNGKVQLIGTLSFSLQTSQTLIITAANNMDTTLSDSFNLIVKVVQANKHDPAFGENMVTLNVSESTIVGTVVGQITATDKDTGQYGNLRYSIESNDRFHVNSSTGVITLIKALEYSTAKSYHLLAKATDNAEIKSRTATVLVCVFVIDTNNNPPVFKNTPYVVNVSESLPLGSFLQVIAEDLDSGEFGAVSYSIVSGNFDGKFTLNSRSGELALSSNLDFESSRRHVLIIKGQDGGKPDDIDTAPRFDKIATDMLIKRDSPAMTPVCQVSASGKDSGRNGIVRYTIQDGNKENLFRIDSLSGEVTTTSSLVRADSYQTLIVAAMYPGLPHLSATMTVSIALTPMNKVAPGDYALDVRENERVGTLVGSIPSDPALSLIRGYSIMQVFFLSILFMR
ncbi:unnamed protein product, partial [Candidula unifasciata]